MGIYRGCKGDIMVRHAMGPKNERLAPVDRTGMQAQYQKAG
jgi:hypothetical protein